MKNQYFGDINDYRKYGLIRGLSGIRDKGKSDLSVAICWMLTPDDDTPHGNKIDYLREPDKWRDYDPELFDCLDRLRIKDGINRDVEHAKTVGFFPSSFFFYSKPLEDNRDQRFQFFDNFLKKSNGFDLLFFDPDNGINVKSSRYGNKNSSKYLYWCELTSSFGAGHSILFYQHFRMTKGITRDDFIENIAREIIKSVSLSEFFSFRTPHMVFFLLPQDRHLELFKKRIPLLEKFWGTNQIKVDSHTSLVSHPNDSENMANEGKLRPDTETHPRLINCACCCGALVRSEGAYFIPGHDGRLTGIFRKVLKGKVKIEDLPPKLQAIWKAWNDLDRPGGEIHPKFIDAIRKVWKEEECYS